MRWLFRCFLLLGLIALTIDCNTRIQGQQSAEPIVWVTGAMERIGQAQAPGPSRSIMLHAARGEYEAFQIGVHAPTTPVTLTDLSVSDLVSAQGERIPAENIALYREHYVYVSQLGPTWGGSNRSLGTGWYPDALIPFVDPQTGLPPAEPVMRALPVEVPAGQNQPFWIDLFVPRDARAGTYHGTFTLASDQGTTEGTLTLQVWDFTLPVKPSLNVVMNLETQNTLANQIELLKHKITPMFVDPAHERRLIRDWGLTSTNLGYFSGAYYSNCTMHTTAPSVRQLRADLAQHQPELLVYNYTADEIDNCMPGIADELRTWGQRLHAAGIQHLVTMTPTPEMLDDGTGSGRSVVDIWVMLPAMMDAAPEQVAAALAKGDQVWFYTALVQDNYSPKWGIDYAPVNYRIPALISQSLGLTGMLYWSVDHWTDDPWRNVQTMAIDDFSYAGEGMLVYPGEPLGMSVVVPSMRLKWIREGIEDYEYVQMLKHLGFGAAARATIRPVAADWSHWSQDAARLEAVRLRLGQSLEATGRVAEIICRLYGCVLPIETSALP